MKVSAAAVILSCSTASAFNVGYLNQLGGNSAPAKLAPEPKAVVSGGPASYLDNLGAGTPELVNAIAAATPVIEAAAAAPNTGDYLSALNSASTAPAVSGGGMTGYLDALPSGATAVTGTGVSSYLDTVGSGAAPAAPVAAAPAAPAPVAAAPAAPAPVAAVAAPAAGDYLSTLNGAGAPSITGAGMASYLDALPQGSTTSGAGLTSYLDVLATGASQTSGAGMAGYLDALATNSAAPSALSSPSSPSVTSFLESVYQQILALPEDGSKKVSGSSLTFASADGPYAMSFVKN